MTMGPAAPILGDHSLEKEPDTLISTRSTVEKSNWAISSQATVSEPKDTWTPMDLREAIA